MKKGPSLILVIVMSIGISNAGCVRTAATWQPGVEKTITSVSQTTIDPNFAVDMMLFTPGGQSGKNLPVSYAINLVGNGVICKLALEQLEPGDTGAITWTIKNTVMWESELNLKATLTPSPAGANGSANYIGIKLISNDIYFLGDSETYVPLAKLMPYLQNRPQILASGTAVFFRLEWQVDKNPTQAGADNIFGTVDDITVDAKAIKKDKATLDINFSLKRWN